MLGLSASAACLLSMCQVLDILWPHSQWLLERTSCHPLASRQYSRHASQALIVAAILRVLIWDGTWLCCWYHRKGEDAVQVHDAAVAVYRDDQTSKDLLVAFVSPANLNIQALDLAFRRSYPLYMVPSLYQPVAAIPRSPNGQVSLPHNPLKLLVPLNKHLQSPCAVQSFAVSCLARSTRMVPLLCTP